MGPGTKRRARSWLANACAVGLIAFIATACPAPPTGEPPQDPPIPLGDVGLHTLAGAPTAGYTDGIGPDARFTAPRDITTTADGSTVWVTDAHTVRSIDALTGATTTRYSAPAGTLNLGDIDIDAEGRVFFGQVNADYSGTVFRIDTNGTTTAIATIASRLGLFPLATTPDGDVLVPSPGPRPSGNVTNLNLARVDGDTGAVTLLGTYEQCNVCHYLMEFTAIDVDDDGIPVVLANGAITQDGWHYQPMLYRGYPSLPTARAAYSVQMYGALSVGPGQSLFTNNGGNAVRVLPNGTSRTAAYGFYDCTHAWVIAGTCSAGYSDGRNGQLRGVNGVHYDNSSGRLYIADDGNHAIRWAHVPAVPAAPWCAENAYTCSRFDDQAGPGGVGLPADPNGENWDTAQRIMLEALVLNGSPAATRTIEVSESVTDEHFDAGIIYRGQTSPSLSNIHKVERQLPAGIPALLRLRWRVVTTTTEGTVASRSVPLVFGDALPDLDQRAAGYPLSSAALHGGDPVGGMPGAYKVRPGTAAFTARGAGAAGAFHSYLVTAQHVAGDIGETLYSLNSVADGHGMLAAIGPIVGAGATYAEVQGGDADKPPDVAAVEVRPWRTIQRTLRCTEPDRSIRQYSLAGVRPWTHNIGSCGRTNGTRTGTVIGTPISEWLVEADIEFSGGDSGGPVWAIGPDAKRYLTGIIETGNGTRNTFLPIDRALSMLEGDVGELVPFTG